MQASRDQNRVTTLLGALDSDGTTTIAIKADATEHALLVTDDTTGSDNGVATAQRDENRVVVATAISSDDGVTPIELYADSLSRLLIQST